MTLFHDGIEDDDERVDTSVQCGACDAVCCRLQVVVMPEDDVPRHLVERSPRGLEMMARGEDGWCIALDESRMCCSIYSQRPATCRRFVMGSAFCRSERAAYSDGMRRNIPVDLL